MCRREIELVGHEFQVDAQCVVPVFAAQRNDHEAQRVRRRVGALDIEHPHPRDIECLRQRLPVDRIRLEYGERVEKFGQAGGPVDGGKPHMLVVQQARLLGLDSGQQVGDLLRGIELDPYRQRIDEQPDHLFDTGQLRWPTGYGAAEHHIRAPGRHGEQHRPCGLHHRIHRRAGFACGGLQPLDRGAGQVVTDHSGLGRFDPGQRRDRARRRIHAGQRLPPGRERGLDVLLIEPRQELPVRVRGWQCGGVAPRDVERQQLTHQQRRRPAVQHEMVIGHDQPVDIGPGADEGEADQWWAVELESGAGIEGDAAVEFAVAFAGIGNIGEIDIVPADFGIGEDELARTVVGFGEGDAQILMPLQQGLRRIAQAGRIDGARQGEQ